MLSVGTLITWYLVINIAKYIAPSFRLTVKKEKVCLSDTLVTTYQTTRCHNLGTTTKISPPWASQMIYYHLIFRDSRHAHAVTDKLTRGSRNKNCDRKIIAHEVLHCSIVMRFVIPVVFCKITNVECVYSFKKLYLLVEYKVFSTQGKTTCFGA